MNWVQKILIGLVQVYRYALSPWLGSNCRFEPTCSQYALQALEQHGAVAGSYLTFSRLARCHPWCAGGHDPVPTVAPRLFSRLVSFNRPCIESCQSIEHEAHNKTMPSQPETRL